jgi:hypothetical protein
MLANADLVTHAYSSLQLLSSFQILLLSRRTPDKQSTKRPNNNSNDISTKVRDLDPQIFHLTLARFHPNKRIKSQPRTNSYPKIFKQKIERWIPLRNERLRFKKIAEIFKNNKKNIKIRCRFIQYQLHHGNLISPKRFT